MVQCRRISEVDVLVQADAGRQLRLDQRQHADRGQRGQGGIELRRDARWRVPAEVALVVGEAHAGGQVQAVAKMPDHVAVGRCGRGGVAVDHVLLPRIAEQ